MNGVQVLSSVRDGRFVRSQRLDNGGRVQSWVLAGGAGAAEVRGTGPGGLYALAHLPSPRPGEGYGHGLLTLVDIEALGSKCTVLEVPCCVILARMPEQLAGLELTDPWAELRQVYKVYVEGARR